jgi:hypothetical protein
VQKTKIMAFTYKLPRLNTDTGYFIDTPVSGTDDVLAQGELTLLDEDGNTAIEVKINDITGWGFDAYSAGVPNEVEVDFTVPLVSLVADTLYSMTVRVPYQVNFFGGGGHLTTDARESRAEYVTRTYVVGVDATPSATELGDLFVAQITNDIYAAFSATNVAGVLTIVADSAEGGKMEVSTSVSGADVTDSVAWVSPVGGLSEVQSETGSSLQSGTTYDRFIIEFDERVRHNGVKGLQAIKPAKVVYYLESGASAASVASITSILDGTYATVADYLGAPNF